MITEIKITNSSGIGEQVVLDLVKAKYDYRNHFIYKQAVVNPAVLYGHNGSGKTSVLKSINNLIQIFLGDLQSGEYYAMPNVFMGNVVTKIEVAFTLENNAYRYVVHISDKDTICLEQLSKAGQCIVYRTLKEVKINNLNDDVQSTDYYNQLAQSYTNPISQNSKLSIVRELGREGVDDDIVRVYNYFRSFRFVATNKNITAIGEQLSPGQLLVKFNDQYSKYTKSYPSIMDLSFKIEKTFVGERVIAVYKHHEFDFETMISSGTKDFYLLLATMLSLKPGSLMVVDELEKTFHPELLDCLIKDIVSTMDIQIICSSHNTHLLQSLRPDQIYFTKKINDVTSLERLSTASPGIREIHNIEKLYLGGRIG